MQKFSPGLCICRDAEPVPQGKVHKNMYFSSSIPKTDCGSPKTMVQCCLSVIREKMYQSFLLFYLFHVQTLQRAATCISFHPPCGSSDVSDRTYRIMMLFQVIPIPFLYRLRSLFIPKYSK